MSNGKPPFLVTDYQRSDHGFLKVDRFEVQYLNWEGTALNRPAPRLNVHRRDAVAGLLHHVAEENGVKASRLFLVKQFRFSTLLEPENGAPDIEASALGPIGPASLERAGGEGWRAKRPGWMIELMAGVANPHEPMGETLARETREEVDCDIKRESLRFIASYFPSMGACSERVHVYYAELDLAPDAPPPAGVHGVDDEEIVIVALTPAEFLRAVANNEIHDSKALVAAEWMRRPENAALFHPPL